MVKRNNLIKKDSSTHVLIDADAFVALIKKNDNNHLKAREIKRLLTEENSNFYITNFVFSEIATVLSQRLNHKASVKFIDDLENENSNINVIKINEDINKLAIKIFKNQTSKNVSFVDCLNMAVMKKYRWGTIFSFDKTYKKNGFKLAGQD